MLRSLRDRFDSLVQAQRESYLEKARLSLVPSFHQDRNVVLTTALQLFFEDETKKGTHA
jgi:hypothetical protein